jgi:hypothetical protein
VREKHCWLAATSQPNKADVSDSFRGRLLMEKVDKVSK